MDTEPTTDPDTPLVEQLRRVQSDFGFRRWTRRTLFWVGMFLALDGFASVTAIIAIVQVHDLAQEKQAQAEQTQAQAEQNKVLIARLDRTVEEQCMRDNRQSASIVSFVEGIVDDPEILDALHATFTQEDCG
jgi:membrane peptidoglycan carboxypeptidase